ncbi:hypothetical protein [Lysinibacillus sp. 54212]|uniref:hypothetical protein n=1 Tax=Lysinibacillus sp. 54212 TaxID=3119829 RepID=UPI002FCC98D5
MSKFQRERAKVFGDVRLSNRKKQEVIEQVKQPQKSRKLLPIALVACISIIALFFIVNGFQTSPAYTTASLKEEFEKITSKWEGTKVEVIHTELPFREKNDALIISLVDKGIVRLDYMEYKDKKWKIASTGEGALLNDEYPRKWTSSVMDGFSIFSGILDDSSEQLYVGDEAVKTIEVKGKTFWYGIANSNGTPVFAEKDGKKTRIFDSSFGFPTLVPVIYKPVGDDYVMSFSGDAMNLGGNEYSEFSLVIDPDYYSNNDFSVEDVILVEGENGPTITRIIEVNSSNNSYDITVTEGTILINNYNIPSYFTTGKVNGDVNYPFEETIHYGTIGKDEVFVMPDNWGSDGVRGIIPKSQILGKVRGYHIMDVEVDWSSDEWALYEQLESGKELEEDVPPLQVARVQLLAMSKGDYKVAHSLYNESISYEHFISYMEQIKTQYTEQQAKYYAYLLQSAQFDKASNELRVKDPFSESNIFVWGMVNENGWKVKFISTKY